MPPTSPASVRSLRRLWFSGVLCGAALIVAGAGCATPRASEPSGTAEVAAEPEAQRLREGDGIQIVFPSSPNLDITQTIRPDGRISLFLLGEMVVAGMTPKELEQELVRRYEGQVTSNEVSVTVLSSSFTVLVSGSVLTPGKIQSARPLTLIEAIWEAGGFDLQNAKTKGVVVMRQERGRIQRFTVDLQAVLDGKSDEAFVLRPGDMIFVPKKFSWL